MSLGTLTQKMVCRQWAATDNLMPVHVWTVHSSTLVRFAACTTYIPSRHGTHHVTKPMKLLIVPIQHRMFSAQHMLPHQC